MTDKKEHIRHSMKSTAPADCVTEIRIGNSVLVVSGFFKQSATETAGAKKPPPHGDGQTFRSVYNDAFSNASPAAFCKASMEMVQRAARSASEPSAGMSATSFSVLPLR